MFEHYVELSITVESRRGKAYPISVKSSGGDGRGTLRLPTDDPSYRQLIARLAALDTDEKMLRQIGQILFNTLFRSNDEVRAVYTRTQGTLEPNQGLRIIFSIDADEVEVAALPWEFLYDPDQIGPMAVLDMPIVRYLPQSAVLPAMKAQLPLKILLTGAETEPKPDVSGALADVQASLDELGDSIVVTPESHLTRQKFQRFLRGGFHIWHFIGHGTPASADTSGALRFESDSDDYEEVNASDLGILLHRNTIRLIVLNACDSGKLAVDPFRSIAPALIKAQIPGVIAMQLRIAQNSARAFSGEFYRALAEGFPLDTCVTEGRKAVIGSAGLRNPDWGIPVVYTRAENGGRLFDRPAPAAVEPGAAASGTPGSGTTPDGAPAEEERAEEIAAKQNEIRTTKRRLFKLQNQAALYGGSAEPSITIQIEDLKQQIAKFQRELDNLLT